MIKGLVYVVLLMTTLPIISVAQEKSSMHDQKKRNEPGTSKGNLKTPEERAAQLTAVLGERLKLTDDQKDQIYKISLGDATRFAEQQKHSGKKSDDKPVFESSDAAILDVLNEHQKEKYRKIDERKDAERNNSKQEKDLFKKEPKQKRSALN